MLTKALHDNHWRPQNCTLEVCSALCVHANETGGHNRRNLNLAAFQFFDLGQSDVLPMSLWAIAAQCELSEQPQLVDRRAYERACKPVLLYFSQLEV